MTKKIAFLFPGQGAQEVGMGKEFIENYKEAKEIKEVADKELGLDLSSIYVNGPKEDLDHTTNTQPAIFTVSMMADKLLRSKGIEPVMTAGHSLGEYSALTSAGVFEFEDAVKLVRKRGEFMNNALPAGKGGMAAIIKLKPEKIEEICQKVDGICEIANYNSPLQIVISGEKDAIKEAVKLAKDAGALKAIELDVSGPFHSSLMKDARDKLAAEINNLKLNKPNIPIVTNVSADFAENLDKIKEQLLAQLTSSVCWEESMKTMIDAGVDVFVEVGPGTILKGLMKRIDRSAKVYNVSDKDSLEKTIANLED
ncbi:MAG TPA: ACP S-malonyltransferase [Halanaerobiales bacterium]|nr:ACP S-malonyltransferase [Halanaerobiales bacterium]